jgi:hypothetical protein
MRDMTLFILSPPDPTTQFGRPAARFFMISSISADEHHAQGCRH